MLKKQHDDLSHFYYSCLCRVLFCLSWKEHFFAFALDEKALIDQCASYWNKFLISLSDSPDGFLLLEKANLNEWKKSWLNSELTISCLRRSKRFIELRSILEVVLNWLVSVPMNSSIPDFDMDDLSLLENFLESFL
jgi:hypothetical protein